MTEPPRQRRKRPRFSIGTLLLLTAIAAALLIPARVELGSLIRSDPLAPPVWPSPLYLAMLCGQYTLLGLSLLAFLQVAHARWRGYPIGIGGILACFYGAFSLTYLPLMLHAILSPNHHDAQHMDGSVMGLLVFHYALPTMLFWLMATLWLLGFLPRRRWGRAAPWYERLALWLGLCWGAWGSYHVATLYLPHLGF